VKYSNSNIESLKQQLNNHINWWYDDQDHIINYIGFDTLNEWTTFCMTSIGEAVLTKTVFAYVSNEKYIFVLLYKVESLIK